MFSFSKMRKKQNNHRLAKKNTFSEFPIENFRLSQINKHTLYTRTSHLIYLRNSFRTRHRKTNQTGV